MTIDPTVFTGVPVRVRQEAVQAVLRVPGVEMIHPPSHALLKELVGAPLPGHESLQIRSRGASTSAELEIGITDGANALEVAAAVQKNIYDLLARNLPNPNLLKITVTVL